MAELPIRPAAHDDWPAIWEIIREVTITGETFALDPALSESDHRKQWMTGSPGRVVVAEDDDGSVVGTANMYANRPAQGSHVASGSLMVARDARGIGVGRLLVRDMIHWARHERYAALQFNAVVETNTAAVTLYLSEGFSIVGTVPDAFAHPRLGLVASHIMWRALRAGGELVTEGADRSTEPPPVAQTTEPEMTISGPSSTSTSAHLTTTDVDFSAAISTNLKTHLCPTRTPWSHL